MELIPHESRGCTPWHVSGIIKYSSPLFLVVRQAAALGLIRVYRNFVGSLLPATGGNGIGSVFTEMHKCLVVGEWPTRLEDGQRLRLRAKGNEISLCEASIMALAVFPPCRPASLPSWIRHSSGQLRMLDDTRFIRPVAIPTVWCSRRSFGVFAPCLSLLLRPRLSCSS